MDWYYIAIIVTITTLFVFLPPLLDGIERKIRALIQSRIGPPTILQTWYDIRKLLVKELKIVKGSEYTIILLLLSLILVVMCFVTLTFFLAFSEIKYIVLAIVLISAIHILNIASSISTSNPFSIIGASRAIALVMVNEIVFIVSASILAIVPLISIYKRYISMAFSSLLLAIALYIGSGRIPYDIHEAEPELASGMIIEFSGPLLALYIYNHISLRFLQSLFLAILIVNAFISMSNFLLSISFILLISIALYIIFAIVSTILGRTRVDIGVENLTLIYLILLVILVISNWLI